MKRVLLLVVLCFMLGAALPAAAQTAACNLSSISDYIALGLSEVEAGNYQTAVDDFTCALTLDPSNYTIYFYRAGAYYDLKDYKAARADYEAVLKEVPNDGSTLNNLGNVFYAEGDYTTALDYYTKAIEDSSNEIYIPFFNRGLALFELGQHQKSIDDFTQAVIYNPNYARAYLGRARTYDMLGNAAAYPDYVKWLSFTETRTINRNLSGGVEDERLAMTEGTVYRITIALKRGQNLSVAARTDAGSELDPLLIILDSSGTPVIADDDSGVNFDAVIANFTIPADDTYTVLVTHADGGSDGEASFTLTVDGEANSTFNVFTLAVGGKVTVFTTEGDRLNMRSGPGLSFEIVHKLAKNTVVTLIEGPRKADGYVWWRIRTSDGLEGWSVERVDDEQTLQPAIVAGGEAIVITGDEKLNMRADAGRSFDIVLRLDDGMVVKVLDGPREADGLIWWKLQTAGGVEGWAVQQVGGDQTLIGKHTPKE